MFDESSLMECRRQASVSVAAEKSICLKPGIRKFASGFGQRKNQNSRKEQTDLNLNNCPTIDNFVSGNPQSRATQSLCPVDQEILVHFHSHQIQRLIGPNAIFPELRRSACTLSTAIMLFRRFYLSNSVIDFHPRNMAAASALLAVKVDCENKLEVSVDKF